MSIPIAIDDRLVRRDVIVDMSKRVKEMELVDDQSVAAGWITDNVSEALRIAEQGCYVLLVSPFKVAAVELSPLQATKRIAPALLGRCAASVRQIKHEIDAGNLGETGLLRFHHWDASHPLDDPRVAERLDIAIWLMGHSPNTVCAIERDRYLQMHLGFEGNRMAVIDLDAHAAIGIPYESLHLIGSRGAAYADDHHNMQLSLNENGIAAIPTTHGDFAWTHLLEWFCDAVGNKSDVDEYWDQVDQVRDWLDSVRRSVAQRRSVTAKAGHG